MESKDMSDTQDASSGTIAEPVLTPDEVFKIGVICAKNHWPLLVVGPPGCGKTSVIHQIAEYLQCGLQVSHPVVDSPIDYKGQPYAWMPENPVCEGKSDAAPKKKGKAVVEAAAPYPRAAFIPYGELETLIHAKSLLIHLADDLGQASDIVKAAYMQLQLARRINGHKVSDEVVFFACTNGKDHGAAVTRFLEPLKDRYHTIIRMKTDAEQWRKWAIRKGLVHEVVTWVRMNPQFLDGFKPTQDFSRTPTPRGIEQLSDLYSVGIEKDMQLRLFAGTVGTEAAVNFKTHLEYYNKIQDPDLVLANPSGAEVPEDPALLYALCGSLAAKANRKTIEPILKYAKKLDESNYAEFSMMLIKDSIMRNPAELMSNVEFCKWAAAHQEEMGL
jgi:hypothetical protein